MCVALLFGRRAGGEPAAPALDSGFHAAPLTALVVDPRGRWLLSAAADGSLRRWRLPRLEGEPVPLPLAPAGPLALAVSGDGERVAVAAPNGGASGQLLILSGDAVARAALRQDLPAPPRAAAFFADGKRLALALGREGLAVIDLGSGRLNRASPGCEVTRIAVGPADRVLAGCEDGALSVLSPSLAPAARSEEAAAPSSLCLSLDGAVVAVARRDSGEVELRDAATLRRLPPPAQGGAALRRIHDLVWAGGGAEPPRLCAAAERADGRSVLRCWRGAGAPADEVLPGAAAGPLVALPEAPARPVGAAREDMLAALARRTQAPRPAAAPLPARSERRLREDGAVAWGSLLIAAEGPAILSVAPGGRPRALLGPRHARIADVAPSRTGTQLRLRLADGRVLSYSVLERSLRPQPGSSASDPPDAQLRASGRDLLRRDDAGAERALATLPAPVLAARATADGRLVVAALGDGTLRWLRAADGALLLSLFLHQDGRRFVAWTPAGYYDASPGAEALLFIEHVRGAGLPPERIPAAELSESLQRPEILAKVLATLDEERAVSEWGAERGVPEVPSLHELLPPSVAILSPTPGAEVRSVQISLRVALRSASGAPIRALRVVVQDRGLRVRSARLQPLPGEPRGGEVSVPLSLPADDSVVSISAETALARGAPRRLALRWGGPRQRADAEERPTLHVLAVGIADYRDPRLRLRYPGKDASDLVAALQGQAGALYGRVDAVRLTDGRARRAEILTAIAALRERATALDTTVVLLAGHGLNDPSTGRYAFVPYDGDLDRPEETLVPASALRAALAEVPGKVVVLLDTCHAGGLVSSRRGDGAELRRFVAQLALPDSGLVVLAASATEAAAQESPGWGNGAFTKAVVEGLRGKADPAGLGVVTVSGLESYVGRRVRQLTGEGQVPTSAKPLSMPDFALSRVPLPLHKRWWFWGVVGGVAAGAVVGVLAARPWDRAPLLDF